MRENRPYGLEVGESGSTGLPYPYRFDSRRFWFLGRTHLSPDGGGFTCAAVHRLAANGYDSTAGDSGSSDVATCRQTVEALLAPLSTAWQRMATIRQPAIQVPRT